MSKLVYGKLAPTEVWKGLRIDYWRETTGTYIWTIPLKNGRGHPFRHPFPGVERCPSLGAGEPQNGVGDLSSTALV